MNNYTIIKETRIKDQIGNRILAGRYVKTVDINKEERLVLVEPEKLIALQRWEGGFYGTHKWLIYIFRTAQCHDFRNTVPDVLPKVNLLFFCFGASRVKRTLKIIDDIKALGIDFNSLSDEYWIHQNARIQTGRPLILPYHA